MRLSPTLLRVALAAIVMMAIAAPAGADQRRGQLTVSVQVLDSCASTTNPSGAQACGGATAPIAVMREGGPVNRAGRLQSATPVQRIQDGPGLMTVIY